MKFSILLKLKLEITFLTHFSFPAPKYKYVQFAYCVGHKDPVAVSPIRLLGGVFECTGLRTVPWIYLLWSLIYLPSLLVLK